MTSVSKTKVTVQNDLPVLFAVGINHNTVAVEVREKIYISDEEVPQLLDVLRETAVEAVVVSTCNRIEIYGVTTRTDLGLDYYKDLIIDFKNASEFITRDHFFGMISCSASQQLFRVATSLDSKIIGDMQILGQVKESFQLAESAGATGKVLNQMFQRAFKIGKQVHTETNLHRGAVSISSAAVEVAAQHLGSLTGKTALVIGAGSMARLTTEALMKKKPERVIVTNRTRARAEAMISDLKCDCSVEVIDFDDFPQVLGTTDVVISSTSSQNPVITAEHLASQTSPIILIDIAVPRDIAPDVTKNPVVELRNIDDLNEIVDRNHRRRMADLPVVEQMVMKEMSEFLIWYYSQPLLPATMRSGQKPDAETQREIVRVKEFLLSNLPSLHRRALQPGGDFDGHIRIVNELSARHRELSEARLAVGA